MFFHEYSCAEIFRFAGRAGCTSLEFWPETPDFWLNGKDPKVILRLIDQHPELGPLTIHAPVLDLNPCSVNPDVASVSAKNTIEAIDLAKDLDAAVVTIHPGRRTAKRPAGERDLERFEKYIRAVGDACRTTGVKAALENMPPKVNSLFSTPREMRDVLDREEWLYFTFDIAHATIKDQTSVTEFIESSFERIVNIHLSRNSETQSHLPLEHDPFTGEILEMLSGMDYDGYLTLEIEDLNYGKPLTSDEKISIARDDLKFIRGFFD